MTAWPRIRVVRATPERHDGDMAMARMGYVVIDRAGIVRARELDPRFGERVEDIVASLRGATVAKTGGG